MLGLDSVILSCATICNVRFRFSYSVVSVILQFIIQLIIDSYNFGAIGTNVEGILIHFLPC